MSKNPQCCETVVKYEGLARYSWQCTRQGKFQRDGNWYCAQHDPETVRARNAKASAEYNLKWDLIHAKKRISESESDVANAVRYCIENAFELPANVQIAADALIESDKALAELLK